MTRAARLPVALAVLAVLGALWLLMRACATEPTTKPTTEPTGSPETTEAATAQPVTRSRRPTPTHAMTPPVARHHDGDGDDDASAPVSEHATPDTQTEAQAIRAAINTAVELRNQANRAYRTRDYQAALEHARAATELRPRDMASHRLAALAACRLGRGDIAQEHADLLERSRFEQVQRECQERGVALRHPYDSADMGAPVENQDPE